MATKPHPQNSLVFDPDVGRDSTDESHQFLIGAHPDTAVPCPLPAWRAESPAQEWLPVVKPGLSWRYISDIIIIFTSKLKILKNGDIGMVTKVRQD